jgi:hypothetical protein
VDRVGDPERLVADVRGAQLGLHVGLAAVGGGAQRVDHSLAAGGPVSDPRRCGEVGLVGEHDPEVGAVLAVQCGEDSRFDLVGGGGRFGCGWRGQRANEHQQRGEQAQQCPSAP